MMRVVGNAVCLEPFKLPGRNAHEGDPAYASGMAYEVGKLSSIYLPRARGVRLVGLRVGTRNYVWCTSASGVDLTENALHWRFESRMAPTIHPSMGLTLEFRSARPARLVGVTFWHVPPPPRPLGW